jgi:leader peptidase (prepilin peptidase)/N-methyltransferase
MNPVLVAVLAVSAGLGTGVLTPMVLHRLAEPLPDGPQTAAAESSTAKIPYTDLATGPFATVVGLLAATAVGLSAGMLAPRLVPGWLVLGTVGLLLASIDARTTWLPLSLTRVAWIAMAAALVLGSLLGGWAQGARGVGGFLVAGSLFWLIWRVTGGGFGFGDVRFAPLVGAATASVSWTLLAWGLVLGSLTGAAVGLVRLATRRRGAFAYAPSILAGGYLAMALAWWTT